MNSFSNLREHVFNVFHDVHFCFLDVFFAFAKDLGDEVLVFDDFGYLLICFFVGVDEVDYDVVGKGEVSVDIVLEEGSEIWNVGEFG